MLNGFIHELQQQTNPHLHPQAAQSSTAAPSARTTSAGSTGTPSQPQSAQSSTNPPPSANPFVQVRLI